MSMDEIIDLLMEVRIDLTNLCQHESDKGTKAVLKYVINGIDIIGYELFQNTFEKLKKK